MKETTLAELYRVHIENMPELYAWIPEINADESQSVGWKMAYRLRTMLGGTWIWSEKRLITEHSANLVQIQETLSKFWADSDTDFKQIVNIQSDPNWQPTTLTIAEFVASGLSDKHRWMINGLLKKYNRPIQNARVEREYYMRGWDMDGVPVVSISVSSTILSTIDFSHYTRQLTADKENRVLDLFVRDTMSTLKGEIVDVVGRLHTHRDRLTRLTSHSKMLEHLKIAPDDDLVVRVKSGFNNYDYATSALQIIVRTKDYRRLKIDGQRALKTLQIEPALRYQIINEIAQLMANNGLIHPEAVSDAMSTNHFTNMNGLGVHLSVKLGDGYTCQADARTVLRELHKHPLYRRATELELGNPLHIAVLNFIGDDQRVPTYLDNIRKELRAIKVDVVFTGAERPNQDSQFDIGQAIDRLNSQLRQTFIVFAPGSPIDDDDDDFYHKIKGYMVARDIQSQFIYEHTLDKDYALSNIVLGILAKTGNIPYVLAKPLPYADIVVGIDVARVITQRRSGSMSLPAVTRVYTADGDFIRCIISEGPIEGETLPRVILRKMFPANLFSNKRVLVHRDGPWRGSEMDDMYEWGTEIGADFALVEVIKSGAPRLYGVGQPVQRPQKGDTLILNDSEAFLVSSLPPYKESTPRPLHIRTDGKISIRDALHSVLSLTLLHYGSVLQPRLPVTIHYSDKIGYLALQGVRPTDSNGVKPYWL